MRLSFSLYLPLETIIFRLDGDADDNNTFKEAVASEVVEWMVRHHLLHLEEGSERVKEGWGVKYSG